MVTWVFWSFQVSENFEAILAKLSRIDVRSLLSFTWAMSEHE